MWPKHTDPTETRSTKRGGVQKEVRAVAPYNFVPLPDKLVTADRVPIDQSRYSGHTGFVTCRMKTLSPLYTRSAMRPELFREWGDRNREMMADDKLRKEYAQFFHTDDAQRPLVPGSSLRGMVRNIMEIASYGRVAWVTDKQLFYRTMDNSSVGDHYRQRMMNNVEAGILRKRGGKYVIEQWEYVRIHRNNLARNWDDLYQGSGPMKTPKWSGTRHQYQPVWVTLTASGHAVDKIEFSATAGYQEGLLVITGDMQGKKNEFVFLRPVTPLGDVEVDEAMLEQFRDDDQITLWQQRAFPIDKPTSDRRVQKGQLSKDNILSSDGDPVFFLREAGKLTFIGRARMFRLPYLSGPRAFVPSALNAVVDNQGAPIYDLVDAIFGFVQEMGRKESAAGRIFFTDARCLTDSDVWLNSNGQVTTPAILASPKPTSFQHYLVQDKNLYTGMNGSEAHDPDVKDSLAHYGTTSPEETVIRGHKLYWHKQGTDSVDESSISTKNPPRDWASDTQHTQIRPVKAGVEFEFRVYFENLQEHELGALLWALTLPITSNGHPCRHKLGMGKPLGLGSVEVSTNLTMTNRQTRYCQLFDETGWLRGETTVPAQHSEETGADNDLTIASLMKSFEQYILVRLYTKDDKTPSSLAEIERISMLAALLKWPGPANEFTRYMEIRRVDPGDDERTEWYNEYQARPVLPNPNHITDALSVDSNRARQVPLPQAPRVRAAYRDNERGNVNAGPSAIEAKAVLEKLAVSEEAVGPQPDVTVRSVELTSADDIVTGQYVQVTTQSTTFNSARFAIGTTGMIGTIPEGEMSDEARADVSGHFTAGSAHDLWIRDVNLKRKRITLTMKRPGS